MSLSYPPDLYRYARRQTRVVDIGGVRVGGGNPIRVQSMITSDTLDTEESVRQVLELAEAGCEIARITAQTRRHAANLEHIAAGVRAAGCDIPLVADIHFKPDAALEAAKWVEKVRVNPGNYADKKKFDIREYTDDQYAEELERIREQFTPLVELCKARAVAMRIGTNHGSLSDRIMNRYGDTPRGMVESALEFARIARDLDYHEFVFSMKASNPKVMIEAYRLLVAALEAEGEDWNYPLHLGVTEAGDGEDGRIKSAIGIGSLLLDGIGDTVRVSLTEDAPREIPVASALVDACAREVAAGGELGASPERAPFDPFEFNHRASEKIEVQGIAIGGGETVRVFTSEKKFQALAHKLEQMGDFQPEIVAETSGVVAVDPRDDAAISELNSKVELVPVTVVDNLDIPVVAAFRLLAAKVDPRHPVVLKDTLVADPSRVREAGAEGLTRDASATERGEELRGDPAVTIWEDAERRAFLGAERRIEMGKGTSLPHWEQEGATYAVTFRLADSLPQAAVREFEEERARLSGAGLDSASALAELRERIVEQALDAGGGSSWMAENPEVARVVADALQHFDGVRYELIAWCVMPNHVHAVLRPFEGFGLTRVVGAIKSFTAKEANALLGRTGGFWQKESYDHLIRDSRDYVNQVRYVLRNPERAGLGNWPWLGSIYTDPPVADPSVADPSVADPSRVSDHSAIDLTRDASATDFLDTLLVASANIGSLLCDGIGDAVLIQGEEAPGQSMRLSYNILQAAGTRIFKTDYVACPSCGRTLFDLQETTAKIRAATGHLKGVRIAVMGCIVNGPGEMADADFGYVGGAPNKINLYVGKEAVEFNIPQTEAVDRLVELIKKHDRWVETPETAVSAAPG